MNKRDLLALYLSGIYCHKTDPRPPSCVTHQQPTIYNKIGSKQYFQSYVFLLFRSFGHSFGNLVFYLFGVLYFVYWSSSIWSSQFANNGSHFSYQFLMSVIFFGVVFEIFRLFAKLFLGVALHVNLFNCMCKTTKKYFFLFNLF